MPKAKVKSAQERLNNLVRRYVAGELDEEVFLRRIRSRQYTKVNYLNLLIRDAVSKRTRREAAINV